MVEDDMKVLIVGNRGGTNVGGCLENAAAALGVESALLEPRDSMRGPLWLRKVNWWFRSRRPVWLESFGRRVVQKCIDARTSVMLVTGINPPSFHALQRLRSIGVKTCNYLTDDPWNTAHRARWFLKSLPYYTDVLSTKREVMEDLRRIGCKTNYLPFAYAPHLHFLEPPKPVHSSDRCITSDVLFAGGAENHRLKYIRALIENRFNLVIYGDYWGIDPDTKRNWRGHGSPELLRRATCNTKVALCLVRRANRDGHVMRTFEIAAMGACILAEDTGEHREILGQDGEAVLYFRSIPEMVERARWLLDHPKERQRLAAAAHHRITTGKNTYADRLREMLRIIEGG